jgi:hypothetical protein
VSVEHRKGAFVERVIEGLQTVKFNIKPKSRDFYNIELILERGSNFQDRKRANSGQKWSIALLSFLGEIFHTRTISCARSQIHLVQRIQTNEPAKRTEAEILPFHVGRDQNSERE